MKDFTVYCRPVQHGDRTTCSVCDKTWDTNDPTVEGCMSELFDLRGEEERRRDRRIRIFLGTGLFLVILALGVGLHRSARKVERLKPTGDLPIRGLLTPAPLVQPMPPEPANPSVRKVQP